MPTGKVPPKILEELVFTRIGVVDPAVIIGPRYGEDASIIDIGERVLVIHTDPITGAIENIGWLSVHIACNDIAVRGAKPRWLLPVLLLPEESDFKTLDIITNQIDTAAKEVEAMIVGGHSEFTPGIKYPLVIMTAAGLAPKNRYVTSSGVRPGDIVLMTKAAAIEGTAIIAHDFEHLLLDKGISKEVIEKAKRFIREISVIKEALALAELGVSAMHDPTEGGILGGLAELAYASNVLIEVFEDRIPIREETKVLTKALGVNPFKLISSGSLVATIPRDKTKEIERRLEDLNIEFNIIGKVKTGKGLIIRKPDGSKEHIGPWVEEELYKLVTKLRGA